MLSIIFGPRGLELTGERIKLFSNALRKFYSLPNILRAMKWRMWLAVIVLCVVGCIHYAW